MARQKSKKYGRPFGRPLREKRVNRFRSDVHAEPHFDKQPDDEGERRDAQRDAGHLREAAFEGQVLGDGDIVVEDDDDQHHDRQHGAEREQIALGRKEQVGQDEQRHGDQVGDAGVDAGFERVLAALALGGEKFARRH